MPYGPFGGALLLLPVHSKIPTERVNSEGFEDDDETGYSPENAKKWAKLKQRLARLYEP